MIMRGRINKTYLTISIATAVIAAVTLLDRDMTCGLLEGVVAGAYLFLALGKTG